MPDWKRLVSNYCKWVKRKLRDRTSKEITCIFICLKQKKNGNDFPKLGLCCFIQFVIVVVVVSAIAHWHQARLLPVATLGALPCYRMFIWVVHQKFSGPFPILSTGLPGVCKLAWRAIVFLGGLFCIPGTWLMYLRCWASNLKPFVVSILLELT